MKIHRKSACLLVLRCLLFVLLLAMRIEAASISLVGAPMAVDGFDIFTFALDVPAGEENSFDTFEFSAIGDLNQLPSGGDGSWVTTPSHDSGFFAELAAPRGFGGYGLVPFGVDSDTDTTHGLQGVFASLGTNVASQLGDIQIAQAVVPSGSGGIFRYGFFDDGLRLSRGQGDFGDPSGALTSTSIAVSGPTLSPRGLDAYSFSLDLPAGEQSAFDSFRFSTQGNFYQDSLLQDTVIRPSDDSGFYRALTSDSGQNLQLAVTSDTVGEVSGTISRSGDCLCDPTPSEQGNFEFAQSVVRPGGGGTYEVVFLNDGIEVGQVSGFYGDPTIPPPPSIVVSPPKLAANGLWTYVFSVDLPAGAEDTFDSLEFSTRGLINQSPHEGDASGVIAPSVDSGFFAHVTEPTTSGGVGLEASGVTPETDNTNGFSGSLASPNNDFASQQGNFDLAQAVIPPGGGGGFSYRFFDNGLLISEGTATYGDPTGPHVVPDPTDPTYSGLLPTDANFRVQGPLLSPSGLDTYTFLLDIPPGEEGRFDTIELQVVGDLNQVGNGGGMILGPSDDSGFYAELTAGPGFGGLGLFAFGIDATTDTTGAIEGTIASLGSNAASLLGNYAVAQVVVPQGSGGDFLFKLFDNGILVGAGLGEFANEGSQETSITASLPTLLESGNELYTLVLEVPENAAGTFDTFELVVEGELVQDAMQAGGLVTDGNEDSGFLESLTSLPDLGGQGLSLFGVDALTDTTEGISGTFVSFGNNAASERGDYAIAQIVVPAGSEIVFRYRYFAEGSQVGGGIGMVRAQVVPEPTSAIVLVFAVFASLLLGPRRLRFAAAECSGRLRGQSPAL